MTAKGWPDAERPGVPMEPEKDGWHWLQCENGPPEAHAWSYSNWESGGCGVPLVRNPCWRYLGPCLTPSEIAAREAAAWCAGRDAAADYVDECLAALGAPFGTASVRALTPPPDMAAALEAVRREDSAEVAEDMLASFERNVSTLVSPKYAEGYREACEHIIAAIRARGTEDKT